MRKQIIAAVVVVAMLGGGGWLAISRRSAPASGRNAVQYVEQPVKRGEVRATVSGTGPVKAVSGVTVRPAQAGTVFKVLAKDGDRVTAGQPVVVLENKSLLASLTQAQLDLHTARTNLENLLNPQSTAIRAQELKVENARLTLQQRQDDLANLTVRAPQTGVVATVSIAGGAAIGSNVLLLTLYDESSPTLVVSLPQETVAQLKPGQRATVSLAGLGILVGAVRQSGGVATPVSGNRDANVPVQIDLPPTPGIRPGMVGQVTIEVPGLTYRVQANGSVVNDAEEVRSKVAGTVGRLLVKDGDRVSTGQVLVELENEGLQIQARQAENDLKSQEQSLTNLLEPAQDPSRQLATYRQRLEQSQLTLAQRQSDVDDLTVKAPVSGTISQFTLSAGDRVNTSTNLFRVADYATMEVTILVDELDVARIKSGQTAEVSLDAIPGKRYQGIVNRINPEGVIKNDIANFEVTVAIREPQGLMAGMTAAVTIVVDQRADALWIPTPAVQVRQGKATVQVLEGGQPVTREIQVGIKSNDRYEVVDGLKEGDQVIVTTIKPNTGNPIGGGSPFGGGGNR